MEEQWKPVIGYESTYAVSNLGRVMRTAPARNSKAGHILSNQLKRGYYQVGLYQDGTIKWHGIHKLVAEAFLEPKPLGKQVNHKDGNKINNAPENLEWMTCKENIRHRIDILGKTTEGKYNGHHTHPESTPRGEMIHTAKFTNEQVVRIRLRYAQGDISQSQLAREHGVSQHTICSIVHHKTWKHI